MFDYHSLFIRRVFRYDYKIAFASHTTLRVLTETILVDLPSLFICMGNCVGYFVVDSNEAEAP